MTLHAPKGLEFPARLSLPASRRVCFPTPARFFQPEELEEERRLCYVGMTRAMNTLVLTRGALQKMVWQRRAGDEHSSRFLRNPFATGRKPRRTKPPRGPLRPMDRLWRGAPRTTGDIDGRHYNYEDESQETQSIRHPPAADRERQSAERREALHRLLDDQPQPNSPVRNLLQKAKAGERRERRRDQIN